MDQLQGRTLRFHEEPPPNLLDCVLTRVDVSAVLHALKADGRQKQPVNVAFTANHCELC